MDIKEMMQSAGFVAESEWNMEPFVWRGVGVTFVATSTDGCSPPTNDDWLVGQYHGEAWDNREEATRYFASTDGDKIEDVLAAMPSANI